MGKYFSLHHFVSHAKAKYPKWVFSSKNLRVPFQPKTNAVIAHCIYRLLSGIDLRIEYDLSFQHEITYRLEKVDNRGENNTNRKIMEFAVIPYEHTLYKGSNRFLAGYTMHALMTLFYYLAQDNDKSEEELIAELVETIEESLIHAKNVTEARSQIVRYDGKGIVAKKSDGHPEDMIIVGKTKVIIEELQRVLHQIRSNGRHVTIETHEYCIQRLMSLIAELRDRELSAEEINLILKGESTNRLTTAPNLYEKFRDSAPQRHVMGIVTRALYALYDRAINDVECFTEEMEDKLNTINYNVEFLVERNEAPVVLQRMKEGTKIRIRTGVPTSQNW